MFDIIVIGGGPAGLTASIYALRAKKSVLLIEGSVVGGQISSSPRVDNFPGFKSISGADLGEKLFDQALALGLEIEFANVLALTQENKINKVATDNGDFESKAVIIATGAKHRKLNVENEDKFIGNGVGYCVVCDGDFYAGKDVAVVGGGNSALQGAIYLSNICKSVTILQNLDFLTGEQSLIEEVKTKKNVSIMLGVVVSQLIGESSLEEIEITANNSVKSCMKLDGLFVSIGQIPQNEIFKDLVELDERGYIISNETCTTTNSSIFVAGDCRTKMIRQLTTAVADGSVASIAACSYVDKIK